MSSREGGSGATQGSRKPNSAQPASGSVVPIIDATRCHQQGVEPLQLAHALLGAGASTLWWRDKRPQPCTRSASAAARLPARVWLNPKLCRAAEAWHADSATLAEWARAGEVLGERPAWVSASAHSLDEVRAAAALGLDAVTLSPIWPTASKPGAAPLGLDALREAARILPVYALGGVEQERARAAFAAHAVGVAAIGAFCVDDPGGAWRAFERARGV